MVRRLFLLTLAILVATGGAALAAEPPNENDPCSRNGRNTCGTNGEGSYRNYRYGIRWFGDYRGAVEGVSGPTFCIDLRFWYPSRSFDYERRSAANLRNKEGEAVSAAKLRRMSRALWRYGRSDKPSQQAAVMLYVHRLMGDGAPGEADPKALSRASRSIYERVRREAERYAGPYRIEADLPERLTAGRAAELKVSVLAASGRRVPNVSVALTVTGADAPARVSTGARGVATVPVTARDAVTVTASADLPAALPALYVPTRGQSARNAQRIVAPATSTERVEVKAAVRAQPQLSTQISAQTAAPGAQITDTVKVTGLGGRTATIHAALYGPYPARDEITCADPPVWTGTVEAAGDGEYVTAPVTLTEPGYYTYREWIEESDVVAAAETACAEIAETTVVRGKPAITTQVSAQETAPGAQITDAVVVSGLGKLGATVNVELWGPFPTREAIRCEGTPFWTGTLEVTGDGTYTSGPVTLASAGYYTYRESIAATEAHDAVVTPCGEASETTIARAAPRVSTVASRTVVKPGAEIFDTLTVSGLGATPAAIELALYGPYASRADMDCEGAPYWKGEVAVTGDGTYQSPPATVRRAGFYVFRERIAGSETVAEFHGECAVESETSLAAPLILGGRGDTVAEVLLPRDGRSGATVRAPRDGRSGATVRAPRDGRSGATVRAARAAAAPKRVRLARLGINAPVSAVGIDTKAGALGIPSDIRRVGWWRDGAAPGDAHGAILIAGHVDSARDGAGAFYALRSARRRDVIRLDTRRYRVTSVRRVRKHSLPASVYSRTGPARLVLVTCGGPFDGHHYRDNVIVTARPA
ncbi:MAG TPA: sortase [Solirubrobacter sp.]|nr:sortase [Solirubrobacter sp.]